jgi:gliding motility-associated lipoprotein GldH
MPARTKYILALFGLLLIAAACDSRRVYEDYEAVDENGWMPRDQKHFEVMIRDTLKLYNLYINVRNTSDYPYSNLFLFVHTRFPDGKQFTDTVECQLADPSGKWLGKGPGKIKDNQFTFRKGINFPHGGRYTFSIEQAMRENYLKGIHDIGLRIELF